MKCSFTLMQIARIGVWRDGGHCAGDSLILVSISKCSEFLRGFFFFTIDEIYTRKVLNEKLFGAFFNARNQLRNKTILSFYHLTFCCSSICVIIRAVSTRVWSKIVRTKIRVIIFKVI